METAADSGPVGSVTTLRGMDLLAAIDALDDAVFNARRIPLDGPSPSRRRRAAQRVAQVRAVADGETMTPGALDAIEAIVARARPVRLTDQVRIPTEELYERLDELRALGSVPPR